MILWLGIYLGKHKEIMMPDLLPCPFCRSDAKVYLHHHREPQDMLYKVMCDNCAASLPWNISKEDVIRRWNHRIKV